jgi:hypothetical protein
MLALVWIVTLLGLVLWSFATWGLHTLLSIDPSWVHDVELLIRAVPYADVIERWFPGWEQMLALVADVAERVLDWVGSNAPLVAWIVWTIGALVLLGLGGVMALVVCLAREARPARPVSPAAPR